MVLRGCLIITIILGLCAWANNPALSMGPLAEYDPGVFSIPWESEVVFGSGEDILGGGYNGSADIISRPVYVNQPPTVTSLMANPSTQILGQWVRWTAYATDPEGDTIYYKFVMDTAESDWSTSNQWDWYPSQAGTFYCTVYVCDDVGVYREGYGIGMSIEDEMSNYVTIIKPAPINQPPVVTSLIGSPTTTTVGQQVSWTAYANDPEGDRIYYRFWLNGPSTGGSWQVQQDWSTLNRWDWYPSREGTYGIAVCVRDGKHAGLDSYDNMKQYDGYVVTRMNRPPAIESLTSNPAFPKINQRIRWTTYAKDPDGDQIYYNYWLNGPSTGGSWQVQRDWSDLSQWDWRPSQKGIYRIGVYVNDGRLTADEISGSDISWKANDVYVGEEPPILTPDPDYHFVRPDPANLVDGDNISLNIDWGKVPPNQVLIVVDKNLSFVQAEILANRLARDLKGSIVGKFECINMFQIKTQSQRMNELVGDIFYARNYSSIDLAFPNQQILREPSSPLDDPVYCKDGGENRKAYEIIGVQNTWKLIDDHSDIPLFGVRVGITDDGLYIGGGKNEFDHTIVNTSIHMDPNVSNELSKPLENFSISGSHGTGVMNVLAADPDDGDVVGVASEPLGEKLEIYMTNIFPQHSIYPNGIGFTTDGLDGLKYLIENGSTILSCSWGYEKPDGDIADMYETFFTYMWSNWPEILFICSAGNKGENYVSSSYTHAPGGIDLPNVITVGNIMNNGSKASLSNYNGRDFIVNLAAPGEQVVWGCKGEKIQNFGGGTSMATPQVTAAAAIIKSINPTSNASDIKEILTETGYGNGPEEFGSCGLTIDKAVELAIDTRPSNLPNTKPRPTPFNIEIPGVRDGIYKAGTETTNAGSSNAGSSKVTAVSSWLRGYTVEVDGVLIGTEGTGSDAPDGIYTFYVAGNQQHYIKVNHPQFWKSWTDFFMAGKSYTANIDVPGRVFLSGDNGIGAETTTFHYVGVTNSGSSEETTISSQLGSGRYTFEVDGFQFGTEGTGSDVSDGVYTFFVA